METRSAAYVSEAGFTMVELMIVILIMAILVAIAVPVFLASRENAVRRTCQSNLRTISGAIMMYSALYQSYPGTVSVESAFVPLMIKRVPTCPGCPVENGANTYTLTGGDTAHLNYVYCPGSIDGHEI